MDFFFNFMLLLVFLFLDLDNKGKVRFCVRIDIVDLGFCL